MRTTQRRLGPIQFVFTTILVRPDRPFAQDLFPPPEIRVSPLARPAHPATSTVFPLAQRAIHPSGQALFDSRGRVPFGQLTTTKGDVHRFFRGESTGEERRAERDERVGL
jgi:hypothetical protein